MIRDDFLLRQIRALAAAIAGARDAVVAGEELSDLDLDLTRACRTLTAMSPSTLDRLPPNAIIGLFEHVDGYQTERALTLAALLELLALEADGLGDPTRAARRRATATALREQTAGHPASRGG